MPSAPRRIALAVAAVLAITGASAHAKPVSAGDITVRVRPQSVGRTIGPHFIGLSFEASALPSLARDARRGNLVGLLRSLGPGVLRFGGISVDLATSFSAAPGGNGPRARLALAPMDFLDPTAITPGDFDRLAGLLRTVGWRALVALPLVRYNPTAAAREAAAASRALGRSLLAVEIGNEPDGYGYSNLRAAGWDYQQYLEQFRAYEGAISAAAPGVPIAGPDASATDSLSWLSSFARDVRPALLTAHFYALSACFPPVPTLTGLLDPALAVRQDTTLRALEAIGRTAHIEVRLGETNNVACEGQPGVSNTDAAALWAVRLMLGAARAGLAGVNIHTLPESCFERYSPFCAPTPGAYAAGRFRPMPEWYALLLIRQLVGERLLRTIVPGDHPGLTVDALASRSGQHLDFVLVNTSANPAKRYSVRLRAPAGYQSGDALWLSSPALDAATGIRLGSSQVDSHGSWQPSAPLPAVKLAGREFRLTVPPASAVLVRLHRQLPQGSHAGSALTRVRRSGLVRLGG